MSASYFAAVGLADSDPILGVVEAYNADPNPAKVNLSAGVYLDEHGNVPVLECVRQSELALAQNPRPRNYLPIDGPRDYAQVVQALVFGPSSAPLQDKRIATAQTLGGTGALKVGADLLRRINPAAEVWISTPSWANHRAIFEYAGFKVNSYPYYDASNHRLDFDAMLSSLERLPSGSIVLLHACCHNPTGIDLAADQWLQVVEIVNARSLVPFLDIAYQGFAKGIDADAAAVRQFAVSCPVGFVANSFSKSFSLYGERVGAISVVTASADEATRVLSQLKPIIRASYSNPPTHGEVVVAAILSSPQLRTQWEHELAAIRDRLARTRVQFVERLNAACGHRLFDFMAHEIGMFSLSGLTKAQVERLWRESSVYAIDSGRISIAAINSRNIDYAAEAIARVVKL